MNMIHAEKLVYEYDKRDEEGNVIGTNRAIDGVDIDVPQGSFVAVLGHNGSGKSTLAKHMNAILIPTGGTVWVDGQDTKDPENLWDVRKSAGMVFQNPDNQIIGTVVEEDVGFGPENIGIPTDEIWERVGESLRLVGMTEYRASSPNKLSGGQKQRVAIAGVIAMEPKCIVLDEPTAMLDPNGRKEVLQAVARLRKEKNVTVILITHYMEEVIDADQVFVMDSGHIVMHGTPREIFGRADELKSYRMDVPQVTMLAEELRKRGLDIPKGISKKGRVGGSVMSIALEHVNYIYSPGTAYEKRALNDISLEIGQGQFVGIIGHTGSGKSTLIQHLNGLMKATSGDILYDGQSIYAEGYDMRKLRSQVGLVFQYPEHQLFEVDVISDVCFGPKNQGLSEEESEKNAREALELVGFPEKYYKQSPFELSGGQKRRVAIAGVLAMKPKVLILDEPTAGLDPKGRDEILDQIAKLHKETGMTVVLVSHSMEDVARYVDRIIVMNKGEKMLDSTPKEVFRHYKELEEVGLAAPQVTYVMHDLKDRGFDVSPDATTIEEAADEIMRSFI